MKILNFGMAKEIVGNREVIIDSSDIKTVGQLRDFLGNKYLALSQIKGYMIAVNETYAEDDLTIKDQDTIAIIPPVSGG